MAGERELLSKGVQKEEVTGLQKSPACSDEYVFFLLVWLSSQSLRERERGRERLSLCVLNGFARMDSMPWILLENDAPEYFRELL